MFIENLLLNFLTLKFKELLPGKTGTIKFAFPSIILSYKDQILKPEMQEFPVWNSLLLRFIKVYCLIY